MAAETTTTTQDTGKEAPEKDAPEGKDKTEDQRIPYSRFEEVNQARKKLEDEVSEMRNKLIEFEDRDKSEVERERAARERAESQLTQLVTKVTSLEKGAWVRSAAAEMNFHDPEDAVTHLHDKLAALEDQREAKRLVEKLAKSKDHLVRQAEKKKERPAISQVFAGDQSQQQPPQRVNAQQRAAEEEQRFAEGLREQLSKFLPENSDNWYDAGGA